MEVKAIKVKEMRVDLQSVVIKVPKDIDEVSEAEQQKYLQSRLNYLIEVGKIRPQVENWQDDC